MTRLGKLFACWAFAWLAAGPLWAGVVVIQNWTPVKIDFRAHGPDGKEAHYSVPPTDVAAIPTNGTVTAIFGAGANAQARELAMNSIHYLAVREGKIELVHLVLPGVDDKPVASAPPAGQQPAPPSGQQARVPAVPVPQALGPPPPGGVYKIPVEILFDAPDPRAQAGWEKKIKKRLDEASDIFEHHCRVRFEVVATGSWTSNPAVHSFDEVLMDFARKVRPAPARLAIGFTSRYDWLREESHLGGTHGALGSHVLIRETLGHVSEPERLEVLVHELGHFLGSAHSADPGSVMRPKLGDRRSTLKSFRIGFDAPNTLVMNLFAEEMQTRHIWGPMALSPASKEAVRGAYMVLAKSLPNDPVSKSSVESLGPLPSAPEPPGLASPEIIGGARFVVQALAQAARENGKLPVTSKDPKAPLWRTGDELMSYYVRSAAVAARRLPPRVAPSAFLLGLGVALDDSNYAHDRPALNEVWQKVEPDAQRQERLLGMGSPTILKRHDVANHFTMSAALVVLTGAQGAESAGLGKELLDSRRGSGFSFSDLCADMSGVMFGNHVREENILLADVAKSFNVGDYVPKMDDLPENVSWDEFQKQYGEANSDAFGRQRADIFHRILVLPPYRAPLKKESATAARIEQRPATEK